MGKPFDFVESVTYTKVDLLAEGRDEREYNAWLTNRALSYHSDTVLYANEMNRFSDLATKMQYDYLRLSVRKKQRRSKWHKPQDQEAVELVCWRFNWSPDKARSMMSLLPVGYVEEIRELRESMSRD
jgi:hypothetical protein